MNDNQKCKIETKICSTDWAFYNNDFAENQIIVKKLGHNICIMVMTSNVFMCALFFTKSACARFLK